MSGFILKMIALVFMIIDHIGEFFPEFVPIQFRWIGRISAPIFLFCMVEGLVYTRNRKKYLCRIYIGSVVMSLGSIILSLLYPNAKVPLINNIFATMFLIGVLVTLLELKPKKKKIGYSAIFILIQLGIAIGMLIFIDSTNGYVNTLKLVSYCYAIGGIIPNIVFCDGGFLWVIMGLFMYFLRKRKSVFIGTYIAFSLGHILLTIPYGISVNMLLYTNYQWMMIAALPFILVYNGTRGKNIKWFFYIFYPIHIWLLFMISNII